MAPEEIMWDGSPHESPVLEIPDPGIRGLVTDLLSINTANGMQSS